MSNNHIEVTDMYLVATLIAYGADYVGVDRADKRSQKFLFRNPLSGIVKIYIHKHGVLSEVENPDFDALKNAYDTVTLLFPSNYAEVLRRVKGIIHT